MKSILFSAIPMFSLVPFIAIKTLKFDYLGWINLGRRIFTGLTNQAALFPNPTVSTTALDSAISNVQSAYETWMEPTTRTHVNLMALRTKTKTLSNIVSAESAYVTSVCKATFNNNSEAIIEAMLSSGFQVKESSHRQGVLEAVPNFREVLSPKVRRNEKLLAWDQPANVTSKNNVRYYNILRSSTDSLIDAVLIGTAAKTEFVVTNDTATPVDYWFAVTPAGAFSEGIPSFMLKVTIPGI